MATVPDSIADEENKIPSAPLLKRIRQRVVSWIGTTARGLTLGSSGWAGATLGLVAGGVLAGAFFLAGFLQARSPNWFAVAVFAVLMGLTVALANLIGTVILPAIARLIFHLPRNFRWALLGAFFLAIFSFLGRSDPAGLIVVLAWVLLAAMIGAGGGALLGVGWRALRPLQRGSALFLLVLGLAGLGAGLYYLFFPGVAYTPPPAPATGAAVAAIDLPDPSQPGPYEVETLTYGSGTDRHRPEFAAQVDFVTEPVDGSGLIDGWNGLVKFGRDLYWGFDATALPLNGRIWAPKGEGPFPLALVVHGNHAAEDFSDPGYAYLGELLASRGIILVSVDENFLNSMASDSITGPGGGLKGENDARAWMLLEHLRQWRNWNQQPEHPFYRRVDLDHLALIGHSRGGEAVAVASVFNRLPAYPDNATIAFDYNFNIRSVVAIAPVDGQYRPSGVGTAPENVNYLTLQGTHDSDMRSFHGSIVWERVQFTDEDDWFKAYVYAYGANHGQFNTTWGNNYSGAFGLLLNRRNLIPAEDQEQIARVYIAAFLEATLKQEDGYRALFRNYLAGENWLPEGIYINRYEDSRFRVIADFDEDVNVRTATLLGATITSSNLDSWKEQLVNIKWGSLETKAAFLGWKEGDLRDGTYVLNLPASRSGLEIVRTDALVFSMANGGGETASDPLDLSLELIDANGEIARLPLSWVAELAPQLEAQISKVPLTNGNGTKELVFQSYSFPMEDFIAQNRAFDPQTLARIRFVFDRSPQGQVVLDRIGLQ